MTENELRNAMVSLGKSLFDRGYVCGGGGNMSLRLPDGNILATPTGSSFGRLNADRLSIVSPDGTHLSGDRPSKEVAFHQVLFTKNLKCGAVVHMHSTHLTALSCLDDLDPARPIRPFTPYFVMRIGDMPVIDYYPPGSPNIAKALEQVADGQRAYLLRNHGPVVTGSDIFDAVDNAEELEETARLYLMLKEKNLRYLSEEEISYLKTGTK